MLQVTDGWLEPLLSRLAARPRTVVCPVIDTISDTTLEYRHGDPSRGVEHVGGFNWNLVRWKIFKKK